MSKDGANSVNEAWCSGNSPISFANADITSVNGSDSRCHNKAWSEAICAVVVDIIETGVLVAVDHSAK